jgi:ABC-type transport system substrate-binding protein
MASKTLRAIGAGVVLVAIGVAILAQGGSGDPESIEIEATTGSSTVKAASTLPPSTVESAPFEYRVGLLAAPSTENFWAYVGEDPSVWNSYVLGPTKPAIYALDPAGASLIAEVAESSPVISTSDEAGWTVRVELGTDHRWSDGTPVTADDVAFTFDTVRRLDLGGGWAEAFPASVEDVVAESASSLRIEFAERPSLSIWPYGVGLAPIMPSHFWEQLVTSVESDDALYALDGSEDPSGGPLQIVDFGGTSISARANPGYPGVTVDSVDYTVFPDEATAVAALAAGSLDTILSPRGLSAESLSTLDAIEAVETAESPANAIRYLGFNLERQPMAASGFRKALALLLDREQATASVAPGSEPAYTMLSPANEAWFDEEKAARIASGFAGSMEARLEAALAELRSAGYSWAREPEVEDGAVVAGEGLVIDGQAPAPLTILTPGEEYDPDRPEYTARIEQVLESLGFDVRPVITDFDTVVDLAFTPADDGALHYDMYLLGWTLGNPSLPAYYRWFFAPDAPSNTTGYTSDEFASRLAAYETATEPAAAREALWGMEEVLARDLPYLVLDHPEIIEAYRSDRVQYGLGPVLGGIQGRLGGLADLEPID